MNNLGILSELRILSLLPAATEIVYLLGLEKYLVGVSHECDYPPEAKKKPKVTYSEVTNAMSSREIDKRVKNLVHRGPGVFHIKEGVLKKLRPNLILTQELCEFCAVGFNQVRRAARILDSDVKIISLEPKSVSDILENILLVGEATGSRQQARKVVAGLKSRLLRITRNDSRKHPRVLVIEWLDPIMVAGHWVPEMVNLAGGVNLISEAGQKSKSIKVHQINTNNPDMLIISPCGFDIKRTSQERFMINDLRLKINNKNLKTYLIDGNAYITRPGPRIIDGIEILAEIIHPEIFKKQHTNLDWREFILFPRLGDSRI